MSFNLFLIQIFSLPNWRIRCRGRINERKKIQKNENKRIKVSMLGKFNNNPMKNKLSLITGTC